MIVKDLTVLGNETKVDVHRINNVFECPTDCGFTHDHAGTFKKHVKDCQFLLKPAHDDGSSNPSLLNKDGTLSFAYLQGIMMAISTSTIKAFEPPTFMARTNWHRHSAFMETLKGDDLRFYQDTFKIDRKAIAESPTLTAIVNTVSDAFDTGNDNLCSAIRQHRQLLAGTDSAVSPMSKALGIRESTVGSYRSIAVASTLLLCRAWLQCQIDSDNHRFQAIKAAFEANPSIGKTVSELCAAPSIQLVHRLGFELLTHSQDDGPRASVLCILLAASTIDDALAGSFMNPASATPILSRLWYFFRLCYHSIATEMAKERVRNGPPGLTTFGSEYVKLYKSLLGELSCPTNGGKYIAALIAYGKYCAKVQGGPSQFTWAQDGLLMRFRGVEITLDTLRKVKIDAIDQLGKASRDLYAIANSRGWKPTCDLSKLTDDPANDRPGFCFMSMRQNQALLGSNTFSHVMLQALRAPGPLPENHKNLLQFPWDTTKLAAFDVAHHQFRKALAVALHLTNRPARGTELMETTIRNPTGGRLRTFYLGLNGELVQDITNNKMDYLTSRSEHNVRIVLPQIATEYLNYHIYARPFADLFDMANFQCTSDYLCCTVSNKNAGQVPWPSKTISRAVEAQYAISGGGTKIGIRAHRQIDTAVDHKHVREQTSLRGSNINDDDDDDCGDDDYEDDDAHHAQVEALSSLREGRHDLLSLQTGRSLLTTWTNYGIDAHWRHNLTPDIINLARTGSDNYAKLWGLYNSTSSPGYSGPTGGRKRVMTTPSDVGRPLKQIKTHEGTSATSTHSDSSNYETSTTSTSLTGLATTSASTSLSTSFHLESTVSPRKERESSVIVPRHPQPAAVIRALLDLYGSTPNFKGFKSKAVADALEICQNSSSHIAIVASTNAGKSSVWQITAKLADADTLVVAVPYRALEQDVHSICERMGFTHAKWSESFASPSNLPQVLIVTYNRLGDPHFLQWAANMAARGSLKRIFLDESHVILDEDFRLVVRQMGPLSQLRGIQLVLMSATIPPSQEAELERRLCTRLHFIRDTTHRSNIRYGSYHCQGKDGLFNAISEIIKDEIDPRTDDQILIVCKYVDDARYFAEQHGYGYYHSTSPSKHLDKARNGVISQSEEDAKMRANLADFLDGKTRVLVGTCAVGVGIHSRSIRHVIFAGTPWSMSSLAQNAGRAGRDGQVARASLLTYGHKSSVFKEHEQAEGGDAEALRDFVYARNCLRIPMSRYLDGRPAQCLELAAELCSVCESKYGTIMMANTDNPPPSTAGSHEASVTSKEDHTKERQDDKQDGSDQDGAHFDASGANGEADSSGPADFEPRFAPMDVDLETQPPYSPRSAALSGNHSTPMHHGASPASVLSAQSSSSSSSGSDSQSSLPGVFDTPSRRGKAVVKSGSICGVSPGDAHRVQLIISV
ncbi:hypothetical protein OC844_006264 [Tilletia horrida]|nr:hypothetical protein OC844_006264 [Tilletia horrida]